MTANARFSPIFAENWPTLSFHYSTCATLNNTNTNPISQRFQDIAKLVKFFAIDTEEVPLFNVLVPGESLKSGLRNLASRN